MPFQALTADDTVAALSQIGVDVSADEIQIERREERWLVLLPDERIGWFAATNVGRDVLANDRRVLRLVEERCTFESPRILAEHPSTEFDVRAMVKGASDPFQLYAAACSDSNVAEQMGARIGEMLAELHTTILRADIEHVVQHKPSWPEDKAWILERLPQVVDDGELIEKANEALTRYERVQVDDADRVLIHGDLGLHAIAYNPNTFQVNGLFDFEGAAYADRHHDFRYLMFGGVSTLLDSALDVYQNITRRTLDRSRIYLYNAACALSYLAFRVGHSPDERWCGRTLRDDLQWTGDALESIR